MASGPRKAGITDNDILEPSVELFPFCGDNREDDLTSPGDWPFDRQCIIRFPEDLAVRMDECLQQASNDSTPLDLHIKPFPSSRAKEERLVGRHWEVRIFGQSMQGTLVDLPCHVESHVLPQGESNCVAYKSADIAQMLIVHRENDLPDASKLLDHRTFQWASGLTPPTQRIRRRKFRGVPREDSEFASKRISEAVGAIRERMENVPYVYEEVAEVDESVMHEILATQAGNVWKGPAARSSGTTTITLGDETFASRRSLGTRDLLHRGNSSRGPSAFSEEGAASKDSHSLVSVGPSSGAAVAPRRVSDQAGSFVSTGSVGSGGNRPAAAGSEDGVASKGSASLVSGVASSVALPNAQRPLDRASSIVSAGSAGSGGKRPAASDASDSTGVGGGTSVIEGANDSVKRPPRKRLSVS